MTRKKIKKVRLRPRPRAKLFDDTAGLGAQISAIRSIQDTSNITSTQAEFEADLVVAAAKTAAKEPEDLML